MSIIILIFGRFLKIIVIEQFGVSTLVGFFRRASPSDTHAALGGRMPTKVETPNFFNAELRLRERDFRRELLRSSAFPCNFRESSGLFYSDR